MITLESAALVAFQSLVVSHSHLKPEQLAAKAFELAKAFVLESNAQENNRLAAAVAKPRSHRCIDDGGDGYECPGCHHRYEHKGN